MGASSGKLVITDKNAAESTTPQQADANPEAVNQDTDDIAPNWDFKPIDEPEETPATLVNGHAEGEQTDIDAVATEGQVNGDVSTVETTDKPAESVPEKTPKKHKNPLIRIPMRLSKINFSFNLGHRKRSKTATTEGAEKPQEDEATEQKPRDSVIAGVADNLVQEVITSAAAEHAATSEEPKETPQSPEAIIHVTKEVVEQSQPSTVVETPAEIVPGLQENPEQVIVEVPLVNNKEEIIINGDHGNHEQINNHVLDSNNINGVTFEYVNGDSHPIPDSDAIMTKLTNLELTNGHSGHMTETPVALNGQDQ